MVGKYLCDVSTSGRGQYVTIRGAVGCLGVILGTISNAVEWGRIVSMEIVEIWFFRRCVH